MGFFYCSKNQKNPLLPRKQWKVGVVGCGQLTTTIKIEHPFGLLDPPLRGEGPAPKRTKFTGDFQYRIKYCEAQSRHLIHFKMR